jgi:hypothetical protein
MSRKNGVKSSVKKFARKFLKQIHDKKLKTKILSYCKSGSFDYYDNRRLKPSVRLRKNKHEIDLENQKDLKLRVKDWFSDIDSGYSKRVNF